MNPSPRTALPAVAFLCLAVVPLPADAAEPLAKANVAHIVLDGSYPEAAPQTGLFGSVTQTLRQVRGRIEKAAGDDRVHAVLIHVKSPGVGYAQARELRGAIAAVRDSGKPVYAYATDLSTPGYLVACGAEKLVMPESGGVMMLGVRAEVEFYKNLFDWAGVEADMLKVGKYKAAAEPYTRDSMSDAFREELSEVLGDIFGTLVEDVARNRGMTEERAKSAIDNGPHTAESAKRAGLVDVIAYEDELGELFKRDLNAGEVRIVEDYSKPKPPSYEGFTGFMQLMNELSGQGSSAGRTYGPQVAVVYASGTIVSGKSQNPPVPVPGFTGDVLGDETLVKAVDKAREDDAVKAVVLRVDSPGGSALASDLMWRALVRLKASKPLVVSMGEVAGSGGYYISMPADTIVADPATITGSIGVVGGKLALGETFKKAGVTIDVVEYGENAGTMSIVSGFDDREEQAMRAMLQEIYELFTRKAAEGRGMELENLKELAGGRIYSGKRAKELGLVDELGTLDDAIALAKTAAAERFDDVTPDTVLGLTELPEPVSPLEALFGDSMGVSTALGDAALGAAVGRLPEQVAAPLRNLSTLSLLADERALLVMPFGVRVR